MQVPVQVPVQVQLLACVLLRGSWSIATGAMHQLMDVEFSQEERQRIREVALSNPDVSDLHDLRTRRAGLTSFIQLHIELDGNLNLRQAHEIADSVEADIRQAFPDSEVLIHQDPHGAENVSNFLRA